MGAELLPAHLRHYLGGRSAVHQRRGSRRHRRRIGPRVQLVDQSAGRGLVASPAHRHERAVLGPVGRERIRRMTHALGGELPQVSVGERLTVRRTHVAGHLDRVGGEQGQGIGGVQVDALGGGIVAHDRREPGGVELEVDGLAVHGRRIELAIELGPDVGEVVHEHAAGWREHRDDLRRRRRRRRGDRRAALGAPARKQGQQGDRGQRRKRMSCARRRPRGQRWSSGSGRHASSRP